MEGVSLGMCTISTWPGSKELYLTLPGSFHEHLKMGANDRVVLWAGNRRAIGHAVFTDEEGEVQMTDTLRQALCLPKGRLSAKAVNGQLHFGPFVGLYALPSKEEGKPFGELTAIFKDMMQEAQAAGVGLYVFVPGEAEWEQGYAFAYVYRSSTNQWVRTKRPLPDLVMSKILVAPPEWRPRVQYDSKQMARQVPFGQFSHATGSKWDVHRTLATKAQTKNLLPDTQAVEVPEDIEVMLSRYGTVYVKPAYGTQGKSIYRLEVDGLGVRVQYTQAGRTQVRRMQRGGANWRHFLQKRFCGRRKFLVQQALDLVADNGVRPVDFRWLIQKDGRNVWQVTARVARVGAPSSITTNLHTGGLAVLADDFLRKNGYKDAACRELLQRMDEAALAVGRTLEEQAGRIGELGIDFGLTKAGDFYLIEVNPRPGRQMLRDTSPRARSLSLRRNLEYAKYTTGFLDAQRETLI